MRDALKAGGAECHLGTCWRAATDWHESVAAFALSDTIRGQ